MKLNSLENCNTTGIYKITNCVNNKSYIGQARNIYIRIYWHLQSTKNEKAKDYNTPIHIAMRKYGIDNFELSVLEQCSANDLNDREQYWISYYNTYVHADNSCGYNVTKGGKQSIRLIKLLDKDVKAIQVLLAEGKLSMAEIASKYNVSKKLISRINTGRAWHDSSLSYPILKNGFSKDTWFEQYKFNGFAVGQFDKSSNELIKLYPSAQYAAIVLGNKSYNSHIAHCCAGDRVSAYGYNWKFVEISLDNWKNLFTN